MLKPLALAGALLCAFLVLTPLGREIASEIIAAVTVLHSVHLI